MAEERAAFKSTVALETTIQALTGPENPGLAIRRLPAFCDFRHKVSVRRDLDQAVVTRGGKGMAIPLFSSPPRVIRRGKAELVKVFRP